MSPRSDHWFAEGVTILDENRLTVAVATDPDDARLMAAAPAMRDALHEMLSGDPHNEFTRAAARAALAEAEGRS